MQVGMLLMFYTWLQMFYLKLKGSIAILTLRSESYINI